MRLSAGIRKGWRVFLAVLLLLLMAGATRADSPLDWIWSNIKRKVLPARTHDEVLDSLAPVQQARWEGLLKPHGLACPPRELALVGLKAEKQLEVWARDSDTAPWTHLKSYEVLAASGGPGPKLREGDRQVPEGIYGIEYFNPNSRFHLSMKVDYPNAFDKARAREEGRTGLGGDIFIHGNNVSIGCLAIGNDMIEELYWLAGSVERSRITVVLAPYDFRKDALCIAPPESPKWVAGLYQEIKVRMGEFDRE